MVVATGAKAVAVVAAAATTTTTAVESAVRVDAVVAVVAVVLKILLLLLLLRLWLCGEKQAGAKAVIYTQNNLAGASPTYSCPGSRFLNGSRCNP